MAIRVGENGASIVKKEEEWWGGPSRLSESPVKRGAVVTDDRSLF